MCVFIRRIEKSFNLGQIFQIPKKLLRNENNVLGPLNLVTSSGH